MRRGAGHKDGRGGGGGTLRSLGFFRGSVQTASAVLHRVGRDEAKCLKKYGDGWRAYMARVPWRMLPGVW